MKKFAAATASILMALAVSANTAEAKEEKTASGIVITTMKQGAGASPKSTSVVKVHYRGTLPDGTEFDSSYKRGQPAQFQAGGVIPGWTEALLKMKAGSKWQLFIPSDLAYGPSGRSGIPPNSTLIFEVELLAVQHSSPQPAAVPPPAANPPLTSDIIKVQGTNVQVLKPEDVQKLQQSQTNAAN
jgi:FKBP-type peptidyl-prolyl cis-trans isomerase